jgi:DNA-binding transcriptional LysR family regulator
MMNANLEPGAPQDPPAITRARLISRLLDDLVRIPGTRRRVGLDPFLGLLPGLGDWIALVVSLDLLFSAAAMGVGVATLTRMAGNLLLDALVGMVPLLGDLFDLGWKANRRNLALLEAHMRDPARTRTGSRWVIGGILGAAVTTVGVGVWAGGLVLRWLIGLL